MMLRIHTSTVVREVDECTCGGGAVSGLPHEQYCGLEFVAYAADARDADLFVDELNYLERALVYALIEVQQVRAERDEAVDKLRRFDAEARIEAACKVLLSKHIAEQHQMERALVYALAEVEVLRAKVDDADNEADHWHRMAHHLAEGGGF